jgi:ankyrin repeat protein
MSLILSTYLGKFDEVKNFVENEKQDVNQIDDYGDSALHVAVAKGRYDFVKYLVEKGKAICFFSHKLGANVNVRNKAGSSPLHKTALAPYDRIEIARYLISKVLRRGSEKS